MIRGWMAGVALAATLSAPGFAGAAPVDDGPIAATVARLLEARELGLVDGPALGTMDATTAPAQPAVKPQPERSKGARVGRRIAGAAIGAVGGAFAGGYLGAAIDGDCGGCDDPGFKGFLIGFPVGGVVGGVLGGLYLFR